MRRVYSILAGLVSVVLLTAFIHVSEAEMDSVEAVKDQEGEFFLVYEEVNIRPWEKDGTLYFFLPSYFQWEKAQFEVLRGELEIAGEAVESFTDTVPYEFEKDYEYCFIQKEKENRGTLQFLKSANVGAVYIETESGSMEEVDADKRYQERGLILVKDEEGETFYGGFLDTIKSRGNSTWGTEKKSYTIKLDKPADLFGMGEARGWILLSNVLEGSKLHNKICLEMAADFGLTYTPESEWVDLYLNGWYWGNYLVCEKIEVGENRVDIEDLEGATKQLNGSLEDLEEFDTGEQKGVLATRNPEDITGGYIIEKDVHDDSISDFTTDDGNLFQLKSPQYATQEQVAYISDYIQQIEDMVLIQDEAVFDYIDLDSFVHRYLLDELVWNGDFGINSLFFYKEQNDSVLYAGPVWDYDGCLGSSRFAGTKVLLVREIENYKTEMEKCLTWYPYLYENERFYKETVNTYEKMVRPYILELIQEETGKIDRYAEHIRQSVRLDMIRWSYSDYRAGHYESFDNNVRYVKYFLARRLRFLDQEWLGEDNRYEPEGTGELHQVTFTGPGGTEIIEVLDGEEILITPEHLLGEGEWWCDKRNEGALYPELPVYEDVVYYSKDGM